MAVNKTKKKNPTPKTRKKHPGGRPTVIDNNVIQKLEIAFSNGASDLEACFVANISKSTLYNYQQDNPEFLERKEMLKDNIKYKAKTLIRKAIDDGSVQVATWYAERKIKDEFSGRQELTGADGKDLVNVSDETKEKINNAVDEYLNQRNTQ